MNKFQPGLGSTPSVVDLRDNKDKRLALAVQYPEKYTVDISSLEMRMQYKIGKCVGAATTKGTEPLFPSSERSGPFSDDFMYRGAKIIDGNEYEGTSIRSALKFAQKFGIATKNTFNVPVSDSMTYAEYMKYKIPVEAFEEGRKHKIGQYLSIPIDADALKAAIYKYGILVVRMDVGSEWWTPSWSKYDILPLKSPKQLVSGHAVVLYGYDSTSVPGKTKFYLSNSWSHEWADLGNGYFYFEDYKPTEAWAITLDPVPETYPPFNVVMKLINILIRAGVFTITKLGIKK